MTVDRACCDVFFDTPDVAKELPAADGAAAVLDEVVQDTEFQGRELELVPVFLGGVAAEIDLHVVEVVAVEQVLVVGRLAAAQDDAAAGRQFVDAERLGHVIVSAEVESLEFVLFGRAAAQYQDGRFDAGLAGFPDDVEAVYFRQTQVEDGDVESRGAGQEFDSLIALSRPVYLIALILEKSFEISADLGVVLNNQHA